MGFKNLGVKVNLQKLQTAAPLPYIVHTSQNHFIIIYKKSKNQLNIADPAKDLIKYTFQVLESQWATTVIDGERREVGLLLEPPQPLFIKTIPLPIKTRRKALRLCFSIFLSTNP